MLCCLVERLRLRFETNLEEVKEDNAKIELGYEEMLNMAYDRTLEDVQHYLNRIREEKEGKHQEAVNLHLENKPLL